MRTGFTRLVSMTLVSLTLGACGGGGGSDGGGEAASPCDNFDCQAMVDNLAANVMRPTFSDFRDAADTLKTRMETLQGDPAGPGSPNTALEEARQAWKDAMAVWQRAEVMQAGPLTDNSSVLRDTLYSWPATSSCDVDQEVIFAEDQGGGYDISTRSLKRRGLDALGYLLFTDTLDHTCPGSITATQDWNARPDAERAQVRADFGVDVAGDLFDHAQQLVSDWDGFVTEVEQAGNGDGRFDSVEEAVNALSDALFYLEKQTNDTKLALPAGIKANSCGGESTVCPNDVESPFSRVSKENVRQNMKGFELMFLGNEPGGTDAPGFSEFLSAQDDDDGASVARNMEADLEAAFVQLDEVDGSLYDAVNNDLQDVIDTHDQLGLVNRQLKNQFLAVLGLSIPDSAAGDGD